MGVALEQKSNKLSEAEGTIVLLKQAWDRLKNDMKLSDTHDVTTADNNALHVAANEGNLVQLRDIVGNFDINAKGEGGKTALYYAAAAGHEEAVQFLLSLTADVNIPDVSKRT